MTPEKFIKVNVYRELIKKGFTQKQAAKASKDALNHWLEVSHCKSGMFDYLIKRAVKNKTKKVMSC